MSLVKGVLASLFRVGATGGVENLVTVPEVALQTFLGDTLLAATVVQLNLFGVLE